MSLCPDIRSLFSIGTPGIRGNLGRVLCWNLGSSCRGAALCCPSAGRVGGATEGLPDAFRDGADYRAGCLGAAVLPEDGAEDDRPAAVSALILPVPYDLDAAGFSLGRIMASRSERLGADSEVCFCAAAGFSAFFADTLPGCSGLLATDPVSFFGFRWPAPAAAALPAEDVSGVLRAAVGFDSPLFRGCGAAGTWASWVLTAASCCFLYRLRRERTVLLS